LEDQEGGAVIIEVISGYGVDEGGNVYSRRSINGKGPMHREWQRTIKPQRSNDGRYRAVILAGRRYLVHVLVARAFLGPRPRGKEVAHVNGRGTDNRAKNLCYRTHRQNEAMKLAHGTGNAGARNSMARLSVAAVKEIRRRALGGPHGIQRRLACEFGVSEAAISLIVNGGRWQAGAGASWT
jgi:hypothetical protein